MYLSPRMINVAPRVQNILRELPCGNRYIAKNSDLHRSNIYSDLVDKIEVSSLQSEDSKNYDFIDLLRNILFADPSMHYSYTDYFSQTTRVPTSIIGFDPVLDDLWQKINYQQLFNKEFMLNTLYNINKIFCAYFQLIIIYH